MWAFCDRMTNSVRSFSPDALFSRLRNTPHTANLLLENPHQQCFDLVRGENVVLMGEIVRIDADDWLRTELADVLYSGSG